ncbi:sensor domain-containing diguanylate cyclase [Paraliobacillus sediminis]|uniref:sensor domain-containing diguanylate cyclase n=1 Tax=Paraliobacillus sediminis TaxID=1885916 RepID=UPI000E3CB87C|nr:sensor domain-containing diguanylate cyclase [Paraliobacillus sediminis]
MNYDQICYQDVLDGIQDMVFVMRVSEDMKYFYYEFVNEQAMLITGYKPDVIGQEIASVTSPDLTKFLHEKYREVVKGREPLTYEDNFHSNNREEKISKNTLTPLFIDNKVIRVVTITRDITQLKRAELDRNRSDAKLKVSRQRYKSLFEHNSDAILHLDLYGKLIRENHAFERLTGKKPKSLKGVSMLELIRDNDKERIKQAFDDSSKGRPTYFEMTVTTAYENEAYLQVKLAPIILKDNITGVYAIIKDATTEHNAKENLIESEEKFRLITENSYDLITLVNKYGNIIYASPSHTYVLGFPTKDFIGKPLLFLVHNADHPLVEKIIAESIKNKNSFSTEFRVMNSEKEWLWFELNGQPVFSQNGELKHMVTVGRDITVRKRYEDSLKTLAYRDFLTNLPNRRLFQDHLSKLLASFERNEKEFAVMILDLDDFKMINDEMGHDAGDEVLMEFGRRLQQSTREMDTVARMGGDEFIILLTEVETDENVAHVVERIESEISKPWEVAGKKFHMCSSIGVVIPKCKGFTVEGLIKEADVALYQAKKTGKNKSIITVCNRK